MELIKTKKGNSERKQISINMIANIVSYSSNLLISFVLTPFLINTLGKETYSFYPMANTIVSYMSVIASSINAMASRFVTVSLVKGDKEDANKYYASAFSANLSLSLILVFPMIFVIVFLDKFMEIPINSIAGIRSLFAFVFASVLVNITGAVFGIATFAKNRIDLRSLRELIAALIRLILFVVLYHFLSPSIVYVGVVSFVIALVNLVFQVLYTRMLLPEMHISKNNISFSHTRELFVSSVWNMINTIGNNLLVGMSLFLANVFYGAIASGTYSIVLTVPQFINGTISMLVGVFYPAITYRYAENNINGLVLEIKKAQKAIGIVSCTAIVVFSALATEFFSLWTPGEDSFYLSVLSFITILPHIFIACLWTLTNLNVVMNKVKVPALFTVGLGILNILISYIIYKIAAPGLFSLPLISSLLQVIWIVILIPQYACKNLKVKWNTFYGLPFRAVCFALPIGIFIILVKRIFILDSWFKLLLFGGCMGCISIIIFCVGMLGLNNIIRYIQTEFAKNQKK